MLPGRPVALLLLIRIRSGLLLILVWITRCPSQIIGRGFNLACRGLSCSSGDRSRFQFTFTLTFSSAARG